MSEPYAGFPAAKFREAIVFAMNMGTPSEETQRATFHWTVRKDFAIADSGDEPFDWTATPTTVTAPDPVEIPCVVELASGATVRSTTTPMGTIDPTQATLTLLDEHYPSIFDGDGVRADYLLVDGSAYEIQYEQPPIGLFDVTVHQFALQSRDEK